MESTLLEVGRRGNRGRLDDQKGSDYEYPGRNRGRHRQAGRHASRIPPRWTCLAGKVQATLVPVPEPPQDDPVLQRTQHIWDRQQTRGHIESVEEVETGRRRSARRWRTRSRRRSKPGGCRQPVSRPDRRRRQAPPPTLTRTSCIHVVEQHRLGAQEPRPVSSGSGRRGPSRHQRCPSPRTPGRYIHPPIGGPRGITGPLQRSRCDLGSRGRAGFGAGRAHPPCTTSSRSTVANGSRRQERPRTVLTNHVQFSRFPTSRSRCWPDPGQDARADPATQPQSCPVPFRPSRRRAGGVPNRADRPGRSTRRGRGTAVRAGGSQTGRPTGMAAGGPAGARGTVPVGPRPAAGGAGASRAGRAAGGEPAADQKRRRPGNSPIHGPEMRRPRRRDRWRACSPWMVNCHRSPPRRR